MPRRLSPLSAVISLTMSACCRYEREFNQGKRPMLKAVLEQDQAAGRAMVLCLCSITYRGDGQLVQQAEGLPQEQQAHQRQAIRSAGSQAQVQLTDGWYGVKAVLDQPLTQLLQAGNLKLGRCQALE